MTIPNCMLVLNQDPRSESQMKYLLTLTPPDLGGKSSCAGQPSHVCLLAVPAQSACESRIVYTVRAP